MLAATASRLPDVMMLDREAPRNTAVKPVEPLSWILLAELGDGGGQGSRTNTLR